MDVEHDFFGVLEEFEDLNISEKTTSDLDEDCLQIQYSLEASLELLASDFVLCKVSSGVYPEKLPFSSDLLFVLDLHGTLAYEEKYYNKYSKSYCRKLRLRDYCRELLDTLFQYFRVAIWSSAVSRNTRFRGRFALKEYYDKLLFVWSRSHCTMKQSTENPFGTEKDLSKIWDKFPCTSAASTVIIDDDAHKVESHPRNCIIISSVSRNNKRCWEKDPMLLRLSWYIEYLHLGMFYVDDVRVIMDLLPFRRFLQLIEWFSPRML